MTKRIFQFQKFIFSGILLGLIVLPGYGQTLKWSDLQIEIPSDWSVKEEHSSSLPDFGVLYAESPLGGYLWVQKTVFSEAAATESAPEPNEVGPQTQISALPDSIQLVGILDGYSLHAQGLSQYFFVAKNGDHLYRFRVGHSFERDAPEPEAIAAMNSIVLEVTKKLEFFSTK